MLLFICPICQSPLLPAKDTWRCEGHLNAKAQTRQSIHSFDVARQGYVNLLPVQQKKSKEPGDSQQSILARQRFLQGGYYQPLQTLIKQQVEKVLATKANNKKVHWLDIGCGEGYYTQAIAEIQTIDTLIAADISKPAVIEVAKASKVAKKLWFQNEEREDSDQKIAIYPLVTSAANLPLKSSSMQGISSIFSPILPAAFARVLQDKGYLVIAKPDIGHLAGVRQGLFDEVREHNSDKFLRELESLFTLIETHYVTSNLSLPATALADLLTMTPYAYRAQPEKRQALLANAETQNFITEAKFLVYVLQKVS